MSQTILGLAVTLIGVLFHWLGIPFVQVEIEKIVTPLIEALGLIWAYYGRMKIGGINVLGIRK